LCMFLIPPDFGTGEDDLKAADHETQEDASG